MNDLVSKFHALGMTLEAAVAAATEAPPAAATLPSHQRSLAYLAGLVGPGRLVMGTDRPYDMSEADPVGFIGSAEVLTDAEKHDILGATTARLLDLN